MAVYDTIRTPDYNDIRNTIIAVMNTGSGTQGYGQTISSGPVYEGDFVTKTQWDALRFDIVNAIVHQSGQVPTITQPAEGDTISYGAAMPNYQYLTLANLANTNRFDLGTGQYASESGLSTSNALTWNASLASTVTASFSSHDAARYFFNSGGKIRFGSSLTSHLNNQQNNAWETLLSSAGTVSFGGNSPSVNFYNLTTSDQTFYSINSSTPYAANKWEIKARYNGTGLLTFTSVWTDGYVDPDVLAGNPPNSNPPDGYVSGTISLTVSHLRATGALYPALVANSFSAPKPSYTISVIG
jgi:hypothetical protein